MQAREWTLEELTVGTEGSFERSISAADVDTFAQLSGDHNPLHTDRRYAQGRGFRDRVVHGALLSALVSRFVGMELPGRRSLLLSMKLDFAAPSFPGDALKVSGEVQSVHLDQRVVVLRVRICCGEEVRARGAAMVRVEA